MKLTRGEKVLIGLFVVVIIGIVITLPMAIPKIIEGLEEEERKRNTEIIIHEGILIDVEMIDYGWVGSKVLLKFDDGKTMFLHIDTDKIEDINLNHLYEVLRNALSGELTLKRK